jgi:subtilisin family serine protease
MVGIDPKNKKYTITFKPKAERPNQRDDKFEIFRNVVGLADVRDILDLSRYTGPTHMHDEIRKTEFTVTDINSYESPFINAKLTPDQANRLRKDPNVLWVVEDYKNYATAEGVTFQWTEVHTQESQRSPLSAFGSGVNVCVLDTGVDNTHVDLRDRVKVVQNFTADNLGGKGSSDHGTHVAGIIGATQGNGEGTAGIAPLCNIWNLRCGGGPTGGSFDNADIIEAQEYARANGAILWNQSFGGAPFDATMQARYQFLFDEGRLVINSAGNTGLQELVYPAAYPGVISISSLSGTTDEIIISDFSTYNNQIDFTAPGGDISSTGYNNTIVTKSGTSMACPCVAGVFALGLGVYRANACGPPYTPGARQNQIMEAVVRDSATKTSSLGNLTGSTPRGTKDIFYGWGIPLADVVVAALKGVTVSSLVAR